MNEAMIRKIVLTIAVSGLAIGLAVSFSDHELASPRGIWAGAAFPVIAMLALSIVRDLWIGRFGVDAIALVAMVAALVLGEPLVAVVVAIMYAGGNVLEDFARGRAGRDLKTLTDRSPRMAHRKSGAALETIPVGQVAVGDELFVRAGEILPVDGNLLDHSASIDGSAVTGEPLPETHRKGDKVLSGTINAGETFLMQASAVASQSTYAGIVRMVEAAQTAKAPFIRVADRFALVLLPATLIIAGAAWFFSGDPIRALAVLVVATPCPLILAAPVAFIGGVSCAARAGVLMKGSSALEALAQVRTVIFDKTGTLTHGGAELIETETAPGRNRDEILRLLASLEQASRHVLAEVIVGIAKTRGLSLSFPREVREYRGAGLEGIIDGVHVRAGARQLVLDDTPLPLWAERGAARYRDEPVLTVFVAVEDKLAGILALGDGLRADAKSAIADLRAVGITRVVMLTGDDAVAAGRMADALPFDAVLANASPSAKVEAVRNENLRQPTLMVGDGINDAPALAAASLGVAMGARGATASFETADVVVLTDRVQPVADAVKIAQRTKSIALQSIVAGLALSGVAMIAAALGLLTPVAGALLQEGIDIAVIVNALRALGDGRPYQPLAQPEMISYESIKR